MARNAMVVKVCVCNKCRAEAHSIPGSVHRRCSGNPSNSTPVEKHCNVPSTQRGEWVSKN